MKLAATGHDHKHCVEDAVAAAEREVAARGGRLTPIRRRVLELICSNHAPVGAYELLARLGNERDGPAAPPTVYRALDFLLEHGLVHRISSLNAFVACFGEHKPHDACLFICERCKTVAETDAQGVRAAVEKSAAQSGFETRRQTIEVIGVCAACKERRAE